MAGRRRDGVPKRAGATQVHADAQPPPTAVLLRLRDAGKVVAQQTAHDNGSLEVKHAYGVGVLQKRPRLFC